MVAAGEGLSFPETITNEHNWVASGACWMSSVDRERLRAQMEGQKDIREDQDRRAFTVSTCYLRRECNSLSLVRLFDFGHCLNTWFTVQIGLSVSISIAFYCAVTHM
jgi:hypothetical protein